jgi:eukaryotic-like serine/threonine-protein kinase
MASTPPTDPDETDPLLGDAARADQAAQLARAASGAIAEDGSLAAGLQTLGPRLGPDHLDTLESCNSLAVAYAAGGHAAGAIAMHEKTLKQRESTLGPDHPDTLNSRNGLAVAYAAAGRAADAIAMHEATLKLME